MGIYCTDQDVYNVYGKINVRKWADLDNVQDKDTIDERISWAITKAGTDIDLFLKNGPYDVPFDNAPSTPAAIKDIAADLAGVNLYESRGVDDTPDDTKGTTKLDGFKKNAWAKLRRIKGGGYELNIDMIVRNFPTVVKDETSTSYCAGESDSPQDCG